MQGEGVIAPGVHTLPPGQVVQLALPWVGLYIPPKQGKHADIEVPPDAALKVPAGHREGVVDFVTEQ